MSQEWHYTTNWLRYYGLWQKYSSRTMLPRKLFMGNLFTIDFYNRRNILDSGCFVECGTWRGGMAFAITELLDNVDECHFFDSFEGLPPAGKWDSLKAQRQQSAGKLLHNNNTADFSDFLTGIKSLKGINKKMFTHKGWFNNTLPKFCSDQFISLLRLDGDWYESTFCILENLYDKVIADGLILIDDYYEWEGCSRAVHDFLSSRKLGDRIRQSRFGGVAYIIKKNIST